MIALLLLLLLLPSLSEAVGIVHQNITTGASSTTQDFTVTDLGAVRGAMVIVSGDPDSSDSTAAAGQQLSIGFTDCTSQRVISTFVEDGVGTTNVGRVFDDGSIAAIIVASGGGVTDGGKASAACITDGIRLTVQTQFGAAYETTVVLYSQTEAAAFAVGCTNGDTTAGSSVDVTSPGFTPDYVIGAGISVPCTDNLTIGQFLGFGFAENGGAQGGCGIDATDGVGTVALNGYCSNVWAVNTHNEFTNDFSYEFTNFDSSGFSITTRNDSGDVNGVVWAAVDLDTLGSDVLFMDTPTSTGNQQYQTETYTPGFYMIVGSEMTAFNTDFENSAGGTFFISVGDATAQYSHSINNEHGVGTSDTQSRVEPQAVYLDNDDGTCDAGCLRATHVSFDAPAGENPGGFTLNFTNVLGSAAKWVGLTHEAPAAAATRRRLSPMWAR